MFKPEQKLQLIAKTLHRGIICHWDTDFGRHWAVILNLDLPPKDDTLYFSIFTSNVNAYAYVKNEVIFTGPSDYKFLSKPTVINLRQVHPAKLSEIVKQKSFSLESVSLTNDHLLEADRILRASLTVEAEMLVKVVR